MPDSGTLHRSGSRVKVRPSARRERDKSARSGRVRFPRTAHSEVNPAGRSRSEACATSGTVRDQEADRNSAVAGADSLLERSRSCPSNRGLAESRAKRHPGHFARRTCPSFAYRSRSRAASPTRTPYGGFVATSPSPPNAPRWPIPLARRNRCRSTLRLSRRWQSPPLWLRDHDPIRVSRPATRQRPAGSVVT